MCEFCVKHGEGKKWYLNVKNYSNDLLSDTRRRDYTIKHFYWIDDVYKKYLKYVKPLPLQIPLVREIAKIAIKKIFILQKWSQIVPIEDVEQILLMTNSIVRVPCACRKLTKGTMDRQCFLISADPGKLGIAELVDQSYFGGPDVAKFEKVSVGWAVNFLRDSEKRGVVHTVWTLKAPFIGAICNCDLKTGCIPMEMQSKGTPVFFRAEYVIEIDKDACVGCKKCVNLCPFGALTYDSTARMVTVDSRKCYGCGVCRSACESNALRLGDRNKNSLVSNLWY